MDRPYWPWVRPCITGLLGFSFPHVLVGMGVPVAEWAERAGGWISIAMTNQQAVWGLSFVLGTVGLFAGAYWPQLKRLALDGAWRRLLEYRMRVTLYRHRRADAGLVAGVADMQSLPAVEDEPASIESKAVVAPLPYDVDARSALLYAAHRTWVRPACDLAHELQLVFNALKHFYESASHDDGVRVWGRKSMALPPKLVERSHWQDWHIKDSTLFAEPGAEPLRTVPRDPHRLPDSMPYYDLRLNKAEVEHLWPPRREGQTNTTTRAGAVCIVDMRVDTHRLQQPSPWLEFHCIGFNGCARRANIKEAQGRIGYKGAEFHPRLELWRPDNDPIEPYAFFAFSLRLPLSDSEAVHILNDRAESDLVISFRNAVVTGTAENGATFALSVLPTVQFDQRIVGNARPPYPAQVMQRGA